MPQLVELHFLNIGHPHARMEEVSLHFTDPEGRASDSTLWLRNGGGKSSLLNLFFSLINPHRSQFLGSKTQQGERTLDDYVLGDDRAVVLAKWQLDTASGLPLLSSSRHFWSGAFYEWRDSTLERMFFSARSHRVLDQLSDFRFRDDKGARLTLYGFRQWWQKMGRDHPSLAAQETQSQREWQSILEREALLDPKLFDYQLRMNAREGGADELFRFRDTAQFVDFFLELTISLERSKSIADNLQKHQSALRHCRNELEPSLALIHKLLGVVRPMQGLAADRQATRERAARLQAHLHHLGTHLDARKAALEGAHVQLEQRIAGLGAQIQEAERQAKECEDRKLGLERQELEQRSRRLADARDKLQQDVEEAKDQQHRWQVASALLGLVQLGREVQTLEEQIAAQNREHAPEIAEVQRSARLLHAALFARAEGQRQHAQQQRRALEQHGSEVADLRLRQEALQQRVGECRSQIAHLRERQSAADEALGHLRRQGIVAAPETPTQALERWTVGHQTLTFEKEALERQQLDLRDQQRRWEQEQLREMAQRLEQEAELKSVQQELDVGEAERSKLLDHPLLLLALDFEQPDANVLHADTVARVRAERGKLQARLLEVIAQVASDQARSEYLNSHDLLPPNLNVSRVLRALKNHKVAAHAGWNLLEQIEERIEPSFYIARHPQIVGGVLVPDADLERAKEVLSVQTLDLDMPIVVCSRKIVTGMTDDPAPIEDRRFVVGPSNAAQYNKKAAQEEKIALEVKLAQQQRLHADLERETHAWGDLAEDFQRFLDRYPREWFSTRHDKLRIAQQAFEGALERLQALERQLEQALAEQRLLEERTNALDAQREQGRTRRDEVGHFLNIHGDESLWEARAQQLIHLDTEIVQAQEDGAGLAQQQQALEQRMRAVEVEANRNEQAVSSDESQARGLAYLDLTMPLDQAQPRSGDVDRLRREYQALRDRLEGKLDPTLQQRLEAARKNHHEQDQSSQDHWDQPFSREDIFALLKSLPFLDAQTLVTHSQACNEGLNQLAEHLGAAKNRAEAASTALKSHRETYRIKFKPQEFKHSELELTELAQHQAEKATMHRAFADDLRGHHAAGVQEQKDVSSLLERLAINCSRARSMSESQTHFNLFAGMPMDLVSFFWTPPKDEQISEETESLDGKLREVGSEWNSLEKRCQTLYARYQNCLGDASYGFVKALREWTVESLEQEASSLIGDLETRASNIEQALTESGQHRTLLLDELLSLARGGIQTLKNMNSSSKLPDTPEVGSLSNQPFLKIALDIPNSPQEQRSCMSDFLDALLLEQQMPQGLVLVQRAVRHLAQRMDIQVLFPDPTAAHRYIPITSMSKESGGERLTSAVLLYSALAHQRARERGKDVRRSSTLLLDNPVGTASRASFLKLQRATARAMNIQLIYATGVNDPEALRVLPNTIRLRNEQRSGNYRLLEVVRVHRPDVDPPTTREVS